jgi:hypothetical protein
VANNATIGGELHGPANFIIDPAVIGANTGTVEIKGNLTVQGTTTTINSTVVDLDTLSLGDNEKISLGAGGVGDNGGAVESDLEIYSDGTNAYFDSGFIASSASPNIYFRTSASTTLDTNALTILNSGNVGIGQNNPQSKLQVENSGEQLRLTYPSIASYIHEVKSNGDYAIDKDGSERLRITSDGDVGIGEISPDVRLHVKKQFDIAYSLTNVADEANHLLKLENPSTTANAFSGMQFRVGSGADLFFGVIQQSVNHGDFFFANQNSPQKEMMRIKSTGNVGIGQNSPGSRLDVNGLTKSGGFQANDNVTPTAGHGVEIFAPSSSQGMIQAFDRTNGSQMELKFRGSDITFFGTSSSDERARITGAGDMALGTISPNTYTNYTTLTINGTTGGQIDFESNGTKYGGIYTQTNAFHVRNKQASGSGFLAFHTTNSGTCAERLRIDSDGHVTPGGDDTQDLGSTSKRWRNIYTGDLQLSNEGSSNEVDGTWGNYTIQEGEEELFIINRRSGKKFKFVLEEVK